MALDEDDIPKGPRRRFYTCYSIFPSELSPEEKLKKGENEFKTGLEKYRKEGFIGALPYFEKSSQYEYPPSYVKLYCAYSKKYVDCILQEGKARYYEEKSVENDSWFQHLEHSVKDSYDEYILALYYEHILKNTKAALKWYRKAVKRRNANAQTDLAELYFRQGDRRAALYWWEQASELGHAMADLNMALWFSSSHISLAIQWCEKAALQGFIPARQLLAFWYLSGHMQKSEDDDHWVSLFDGVMGADGTWKQFDLDNTFQNLSMLAFMNNWGSDRSSDAYWERKLGKVPLTIAMCLFVFSLLLFWIECVY